MEPIELAESRGFRGSELREIRAKWRLIGHGVDIHWEDVDEDISVRARFIIEYAKKTVLDANKALESNPALTNTDPFGEGWIFVLKIDNADDLRQLKDAAAYRATIS